MWHFNHQILHYVKNERGGHPGGHPGLFEAKISWETGVSKCTIQAPLQKHKRSSKVQKISSTTLSPAEKKHWEPDSLQSGEVLSEMILMEERPKSHVFREPGLKSGDSSMHKDTRTGLQNNGALD